MAWGIEGTDEFQAWFAGLAPAERVAVAAKIDVLQEQGPGLGRPTVDQIHGSRFPNMKELRIQHAGKPYRVLFAFDPRRTAILLIGGRKRGGNNWYEVAVPIADDLYEQYLGELKKEGLI